jgi:hypothetical protein
MLADREGEIKVLTLRTADMAEAMKNKSERVAAGTEEEEERKGAAVRKVEEQMKNITALENDLANKQKENDELRVLLEKEGAECRSLNLRIVTILEEKEREERKYADIFSQSEGKPGYVFLARAASYCLHLVSLYDVYSFADKGERAFKAVGGMG